MFVRYVKIIIIISLLIGICPHTLFAQNTDLRGQVVAYNPYARNVTPVSNIRVDLYKYNNYSRRWDRVYTTYTDPYGMYYMYNIPPDKYYLQVNRVNYPLPVGSVDRRRYRYQDVPRIQLR